LIRVFADFGYGFARFHVHAVTIKMFGSPASFSFCGTIFALISSPSAGQGEMERICPVT
jgi:hypothetical protein